MSDTPPSVGVLTGALLAAGAVTGALAAGPVGRWWLLLPLGAALIVGETLQVEFTYGRDVRAVDVFEAVLAPVLLVFAGPVAVLLAVVSKTVSQHRLGIARTKALFNVAQWAAAVGVASLVYRSLAGGDAGQTSSLPALVVALLAFAVTNEVAMAGVLRAVNQVSLRHVLADLAPQYPPHALIWSVNAALGVLFAVAVAAAPATAFLLLAPLAFLRWSHQAYLSLLADRSRLDGLARAVARLAAPIDPRGALPAFLEDVRASFGSRTVELVRFEPAEVLRAGEAGVADQLSIEIAALLVSRGGIRRATAAGEDAPVAAALVAGNHRDALVAPLVQDGRPVGALVSYDRTGFVGFDEGEEAVLAALAAAVTRAIEKSDLLDMIGEERRRLAEIVDRSSDGIFTVGPSGTVESWNPAMEEMTGLAAEFVIGTPGFAELQPEAADGTPVRFERWRDDGIPAEVRIVTEAGERWLGCSSAVGGGGATLVVVARDVTRAREVDRMKDDFIATVSHELRTPLATIRGFTDLLEPSDKVTDEVRRQAVGRIRRGTHRLERLVANLLEVSRMEGGRSSTTAAAKLDLVALVERVVDEVQESWPDRQIQLDADEGLGPVEGSALSLERILINLLSNALTYADTGPVHLTVRRQGEAGVTVSVRDHGPGIPLHDQARVFERFERLDTPNRKAGTGLGLYIARGLARAMGADLGVRSEPGEGAEFTLRLRVSVPEPSAPVIDLVG